MSRSVLSRRGLRRPSPGPTLPASQTEALPIRRAIALTAVALISTASASAPQPAPAAPRTPVPAVGAMAPDFTLPGATRYGVLQKPASLSDYRGKTVVLAFFFRARTRG